MASSNRASREVPRPAFGTACNLCPMHGLPIVGTTSVDGANDPSQPAAAAPNDMTEWEAPNAIPGYDVERDAAAVPYYTRDHLQKLSACLHARLAKMDGFLGTYPRNLSRTRKIQKFFMAIVLTLGILWIIISIISLISFLRGRRF
ncbi:hypothetical protein HD806DRAFT_550840 [Xylariaceae sp. AK1471]|nr:hypothetical protein HD806DRAFT_550840 [Xylariaceae sp. AK1471]